jgi:hypothetical protein
MRLLSVGLALALWGGLGTGQALAIPIVYGHGDTITPVADLPPAVVALFNDVPQGDRPDKLGFKYWRLHIFWADLWTSDGEFVVYRAIPGQYFTLPSQDAKDIATNLQLKPEQVSRPFLFRIPLGWIILTGLAVCVAFASFAEKGKRPPPLPVPAGPAGPVDAERLLDDPRYQQALREVFPRGDPLEQVTTQDIQRGIDSLITHEVPREQAEANLARLLEYARAQCAGDKHS